MRIGTGACRRAIRTPKLSATPSRRPGASGSSSTTPAASSPTRPELDKALLVAERASDQLVVTKLDRLGRSLEHLIELSKLLQARGVDLVVLDQGIDTSTAVGRLFFQIIGAIGEFEHALMRERTMDGLAAARGGGRTGGQEPKLSPRQIKFVREAYDRRDCTVAEMAADFGVTRQTVYRALKKTETGATPRV